MKRGPLRPQIRSTVAQPFRERCRKNVIYDFASCRRVGRRKWTINETIARRSTLLTQLRSYIIYVTARAKRTRSGRLCHIFLLREIVHAESVSLRLLRIKITRDRLPDKRAAFFFSFLVMQGACIILSEIDYIFFSTYLDCLFSHSRSDRVLSSSPLLSNPRCNEFFTNPFCDSYAEGTPGRLKRTRARARSFLQHVRIIALCYSMWRWATNANYFVEFRSPVALRCWVQRSRRLISPKTSHLGCFYNY